MPAARERAAGIDDRAADRMKQALGLAHFEGRTWKGWHHHVPPRLGCPRLLHPPTFWPGTPNDGAGLTLYRIVRKLQRLLATGVGTCPICDRDEPTLTPA